MMMMIDDLFARLMREHRRTAELARRDATADWSYSTNEPRITSDYDRNRPN